MNLPELIEPHQLAEAHKTLTGKLALKDLTRAEGLLLPTDEFIYFTWQFQKDDHGEVTSTLKITAALNLQCQRCQAPFAYKLEVTVPMQVVSTETQAEQLPLAIQPLYVDNDGRCLALPVLEDELILNIPEFPKHEKKDCSLPKNQAYYAPLANSDMQQTTHKPFANLKVLSKEKK
jgi:uncharacterized protein